MHSRLKCKTKQKIRSVRKKKTLVPKVKLKNKQTNKKHLLLKTPKA